MSYAPTAPAAPIFVDTETFDEFAALIGQMDDYTNNRIYVTNAGEIRAIDTHSPGAEDEMKRCAAFYYESSCTGGGYFGPDAAKDKAYIQNELKKIRNDWEKGCKGYLDW